MSVEAGILPSHSNHAAALFSWYKSGGDVLICLSIFLTISLFIGQERVVSKGDVEYWFLIIPALTFPLMRLRPTLENLAFGCARPIAAFGTTAAIWCAIGDDFKAILPIILMVWVAGWTTRKEIAISRSSLLLLALVFYLVGIGSYYAQSAKMDLAWLSQPIPETAAAISETGEVNSAPVVEQPEQSREGLDINAWGVLPGQTAEAFLPWRVSATPNIATSGVFSLLIFLVWIGRPNARPQALFPAALSAYFAALSFVRSVFVGASLFWLTRSIMNVVPARSGLRAPMAFMILLATAIIGALSPYILYYLQDIDIVSRALLRGRDDMSIKDIYRQTYRPWLWIEHFKLFWQSSYLMGQGSEILNSATTNILNAGHVRSDSVSFLTRMLATYGIPALGIFWFLFERCAYHARNNDTWAVAMLVVVIWLMMSWGSLFHPTNGVFVLSLLIAARGSESFENDAR